MSSSRADVRPTGNGRYQQALSAVSTSSTGIKTVTLSVMEQLQSSGTLSIVAGKYDSIGYKADLEISSDSRDDAQKLLESFSISKSIANQELQLTTTLGPNQSSKIDFGGSRLNISIAVPEGVNLVITAPYLSTEVSGPAGDVTITRTLAPLKVDGLRGVITATATNARVTLTDILGGMNINATNSRVRLNDVAVDHANKVSSDIAKIVSDGGDVELYGFTGPLNVTVVRGSLKAKDIRLHGTISRIENNGGEIDVEINKVEPTVQLTVDNTYDDIRLQLPTELNARLRLRMFGDGGYSIDGILHHIASAQPDRLEAVCGDGAAMIEVRALDGSNIIITGK